MLFYGKEENEEDTEIALLIGRLEVVKRMRGMSEKELYELQLELKSPQNREEYSKKYGYSLLELERLYNDLKFRRRCYRNLRKESKENAQKEEVSQMNKEKSGENEQAVS